jgi:hypothetical protein
MNLLMETQRSALLVEPHLLRHLTPELILALDELIDRAITFGGDYAQAFISLQVEKRQVRQLNLVPVPGFSVRVPNGSRQS